jgi:hypothetical protein
MAPQFSVPASVANTPNPEGSRMELIIDPDVKAVAEFMQSSVQACRLVSVAQAVAKLAPILWDIYDAEAVRALSLEHPQPSRLNENVISPRAANGSELRPI